jgi:hypothetical protein
MNLFTWRHVFDGTGLASMLLCLMVQPFLANPP